MLVDWPYSVALPCCPGCLPSQAAGRADSAHDDAVKSGRARAACSEGRQGGHLAQEVAGNGQ
eukprot:COSAG01_NODE_69910_length_260_cov_0.633540_1_plen_61_part_10